MRRPRRIRGVQGWDRTPGWPSIVWTAGRAVAVMVLAVALGASETFARTPVPMAVWIGAGDANGPADAAHLAAVWSRAGGANLAVLTGATVRAELVLAALIRLRARLQTGDLAVVGYSGPLAPATDGESGAAWAGLEGKNEAEAVPAAVSSLLGSCAASVVVIQIAAGVGRAAGAPAASAFSFPEPLVLWSAGAAERPAETWFGRSRAADALARELERIRTRPAGGSVGEWLRAAIRRCELESAGRTVCSLSPSNALAGVTWPQGDVLQLTPLGQLGSALEQLAEVVGHAPGDRGSAEVWATAWRVAREEGASRVADWLAELAVALRPEGLTAEQVEDRVVAASAVWRQGRREEAEQKLRAILRAEPRSLVARALLAEVRWEQEDPTDAVRMATEVLRETDASGASAAVARFHAARVLGMSAEARQDFVEAVRQYRIAADAAAAGRVADTALVTGTRRRLVRALRLAGDPGAAAAQAEEALAAARAAVEAGPEVPLLCAEMGDARFAVGQLDAAIDAWRTACDEWSVWRGGAPPLSVVVSLGSALLERGETDEAIRRLQAAAEGAAATSVEEVERVRLQILLSWAWNQRGDRIRALQHAQEAWRMAAARPEIAAQDLATLHADLAALHLNSGDAARAAEFAERALAEWARSAVTNRPSLSAVWVLLADARMRLHRYAEAAVAWSNAAAVLVELGPESRSEWVRARTQEVLAWIEAGALEEAVRSSDSLAAYGESFGGALSARALARIWLQRARALAMAGRADEADEAYGRAWSAIESAGGAEADPLLRAEIAVRRAALLVARGRLFDARAALSVAGDLPPELARDLVATVRRVRAVLDEAMKPHGPITIPADIAAIQILEMDYRTRRARGPAPVERQP